MIDFDLTTQPVAPPPDDGLIYPGSGASKAGASRLAAANHCDRWFAYRHGLLAFRGGSVAQAGGALVHAGVAQHYARLGAAQPDGIVVSGKHVNTPSQLGTIEQAIDREAALRGLPPGSEQEVDARSCTEQYIAHYRRDSFRILHVEEEYAATIPCKVHHVTVLAAQRHALNPAGVVVASGGVEGSPEATVTLEFSGYLWTTRTDLVVSTGSKVFIADHKTTGRIEAKHPRVYALTGQMAGLRWLGQQVYGERFGGVILNMIQRDAPYKFERPNMDAGPALSRDFPQHVRDTEARIEALAARCIPFGQWPTASSELVCYHRYGRCPAADACLWGSSP